MVRFAWPEMAIPSLPLERHEQEQRSPRSQQSPDLNQHRRRVQRVFQQVMADHHIHHTGRQGARARHEFDPAGGELRPQELGDVVAQAASARKGGQVPAVADPIFENHILGVHPRRELLGAEPGHPRERGLGDDPLALVVLAAGLTLVRSQSGRCGRWRVRVQPRTRVQHDRRCPSNKTAAGSGPAPASAWRPETPPLPARSSSPSAFPILQRLIWVSPGRAPRRKERVTLRANTRHNRLAVRKTNDAMHKATSIARRCAAAGKDIPIPVARAT